MQQKDSLLCSSHDRQITNLKSENANLKNCLDVFQQYCVLVDIDLRKMEITVRYPVKTSQVLMVLKQVMLKNTEVAMLGHGRYGTVN
ncbi:unnamed protein product [Ambrosiozyma monospora]|uniref:Unnamed protein product n=1 Tax=Ambrosiozyma monospora TaxID=43982 RepID=A0ACB5SR24_AMBMO|nr:unnamed protein product [Ambrosiozyma monospora]